MDRKSRLIGTLQSVLAPQVLDVEDQSARHRRGEETHYRVVAVSSHFEGKSRVARHQLVHRAVEAEFRAGLHALTLDLFTPSEWEKNPERLATPHCVSGKKGLLKK